MSLTILDYQTKYQPDFERLNRQWIEALFTMEPVDEYVLKNPEAAILQPGGVVLMALISNAVAGTVALKKVNEHTYEFTKMAVAEDFRRRGIAEALSYASFEKARALGATTILLYSNTKNAGALKLYEKLGFRYLPVENDVYQRANIKMGAGLHELLPADNNESKNIHAQ